MAEGGSQASTLLTGRGHVVLPPQADAATVLQQWTQWAVGVVVWLIGSTGRCNTVPDSGCGTSIPVTTGVPVGGRPVVSSDWCSEAASLHLGCCHHPTCHASPETTLGQRSLLSLTVYIVHDRLSSFVPASLVRGCCAMCTCSTTAKPVPLTGLLCQGKQGARRSRHLW